MALASYHISVTTFMTFCLISAAEYNELGECVVKVSGHSSSSAVFNHNHELSLRLWYWAPGQPTNFTISIISSIYNKGFEETSTSIQRLLDEKGWKTINIVWPRPASNLSVISTNSIEEKQDHESVPWKSLQDSVMAPLNKDVIGLHITSSNQLIWVNTNPQLLSKDDNCQEVAHIVNYLLGLEEIIPSNSYSFKTANKVPEPENVQDFDTRSVAIIALAILLVVALLALAVICCYMRQHTTQGMVKYEHSIDLHNKMEALAAEDNKSLDKKVPTRKSLSY